MCSLIDIRHAASALDETMVGFLIERELPFAVILTKADKLSKQQQQKQKAVLAKQLQLPKGTPMVVTSSAKGTGIDEVRRLIEEAAAR